MLSTISGRKSRSLTTPGSESSAVNFRRLVTQRDAACVVARSSQPVVASRLIPKRIGSDGVKAIVERFVGIPETTGIRRYDPRIGITLLNNIGSWVDHHQAGFYHVTVSSPNPISYRKVSYYSIVPTWRRTILIPSTPSASTSPRYQSLVQLLCRYFQTRTCLHSAATLTLSVHAGDQPLPPQGVFNWHYLQCVIHRFGTPQYKGFPNVEFFVYPFRTGSDSPDDESIGDHDNDVDPPYPSYHFDRYLERQSESQRAIEHRKDVLRWASDIPSGIG